MKLHTSLYPLTSSLLGSNIMFLAPVLKCIHYMDIPGAVFIFYTYVYCVGMCVHECAFQFKLLDEPTKFQEMWFCY